MPELPEVETTCRGIAPHIEGHVVDRVIVRERRLRWPVPRTLSAMLTGARVEKVSRRAKYLLVGLDRGTVLIHLGMSGSLRILRERKPAKAHDHLDFLFDDGLCLRYNDPRRFGSVHFIKGDPMRHRLLCDLGPEPLAADFDGQRLFDMSRGRRGAVKNFVMDQAIVVGVGNIYACEALFTAGIHPARQAGRVSQQRYTRLADAVKVTLASAIDAGGTTLRDFVGSDGKPGYFRQELQVYGREKEACVVCSATIRRTVIGQRSTFFCSTCQR